MDCEATWSSQHLFGPVVYQDKIWVMGGHDGIYRNDVWVSDSL